MMCFLRCTFLCDNCRASMFVRFTRPCFRDFGGRAEFVRVGVRSGKSWPNTCWKVTYRRWATFDAVTFEHILSDATQLRPHRHVLVFRWGSGGMAQIDWPKINGQHLRKPHRLSFEQQTPCGSIALPPLYSVHTNFIIGNEHTCSVRSIAPIPAQAAWWSSTPVLPQKFLSAKAQQI